MKEKIKKFFATYDKELVLTLSAIASIVSIIYCYVNGIIVAYGDAESHLNISKRVIDSITPGFAQLGGVWLPLPHLLMIPFVYSDFLWQTGLAGSIISGSSFIIASLFLYKTMMELTNNHKLSSFFSVLIFIANPNALYMQATPMTETLLICFLIITSYYFILFLKNDKNIGLLIISGFFGFLTTLTRYDGWFLVAFMAGILGMKYFPIIKFPKKFKELKENFSRKMWNIMEGRLILFCSIAFLGIFLWFAWDYIILGDPLYFTHSEFSAKSQQNALLNANQLPAYKNLSTAISYYFATSSANIGLILFSVSFIGFLVFIIANKRTKLNLYIGILYSVILIFNIYTLYAGQSVIFLPSINPDSFKENIFNVRYGLMMLPFTAVFFSYLFYVSKRYLKVFLFLLFAVQIGIFFSPQFITITLADGLYGISSSVADEDKIKASYWIRDHYKEGLVLMDDYARPISITESRIPMEKIIYIGNKPYWEESFKEPEKHAEWIVFKEGDSVWKNIYKNEIVRNRLYKYFDLVYSEKDRMIFKKKSV